MEAKTLFPQLVEDFDRNLIPINLLLESLELTMAHEDGIKPVTDMRKHVVKLVVSCECRLYHLL
jgi:hypothetical protein